MKTGQLVWTQTSDSLPVIPERCWRTDRLVLARSKKYGVLALWFTRGWIDEDGTVLYSGTGDQRLWLSNDKMQCEESIIDDIVEWADFPI